jgi:hypothetical protein
MIMMPRQIFSHWMTTPMTRALIALLAFAPLAACAPAYSPEPEPAPAVASLPPAPVAGVSGLQSREPDACHAKDYVSALGQPGSVVGTLGVTREYRVVEYRGIEPQEYNPLRIVFRLDAAGNIYNIDCG